MSAHELTLADDLDPEFIDLDDPADFEDGAFDGETIAFEEITLED